MQTRNVFNNSIVSKEYDCYFLERSIKEIKKTLHKTLRRSHLSYEAFESVIMDIERNLNRPLTYVEAQREEVAVLTPNMILWGCDVYAVEDTEGSDVEKLTRMAKRLENAKANAWKRWKREYVHSLMESHRLNKETGTIPQVGENVLIIGDEKNRREWRKGKVVRLIKGKDDVVRGVTLLHKRHTIDQPLQLVCPLEIRTVENVDQSQKGRRDRADVGEQRPRRAAAQRAAQRIAEQLQEEEN